MFELNLLAPNQKKGCSVTHGYRSRAFWRAKTGAATTAQSSRVGTRSLKRNLRPGSSGRASSF